MAKSIQEAIDTFNQTLSRPLHLKGIFFDMDGVLFNSMPLHSKAWLQVFEEHGFPVPQEEFYQNEGSTALFTVRKMYRKYRNEEVSDEFAEEFKLRKRQIMEELPESEVMPLMPGFLDSVNKSGISCWVVTGSAQDILLDRLEKEFSGSLARKNMVTAYDVKKGKPDPEPYLKAMKKSGFGTSSALVIENAPIGVLSANAAGLFTIAINTGPIDPEMLKEAGADLVFPGCKELIENWPQIFQLLK
jgi:HAD superfamily hydrolase (TIGR01509 family)